MTRNEVTRISAYGLLCDTDGILLCRMSQGVAGAGMWTLPGGGIEFEKIYLTTKISDKVFESQGNLFETIFETIQNQFDGKYKFKNCFGCLYFDYSVYGQSVIGT